MFDRLVTDQKNGNQLKTIHSTVWLQTSGFGNRIVNRLLLVFHYCALQYRVRLRIIDSIETESQTNENMGAAPKQTRH